MIVHEVPPPDREAFCRRFTEQHAGERVIVAADSEPERPRQAAADDAWHVFERIDYDPALERLRVLTRADERTRAFDLDGVQLLTVLQPEDGQGRLEVELASGHTTRLTFDSILIPGFLDGLAPSELG